MHGDITEGSEYPTEHWYFFVKYILLIILLQFSQFFSLHPAPQPSSIPPTLVHDHEMYI